MHANSYSKASATYLCMRADLSLCTLARRPSDPMPTLHHVETAAVRRPDGDDDVRVPRGSSGVCLACSSSVGPDEDEGSDVRLEVSSCRSSYILYRYVTKEPLNKLILCLYRCSYSDGVLVPPRPGASAEPTATAGNQGTTIIVRCSSAYTLYDLEIRILR